MDRLKLTNPFLNIDLTGMMYYWVALTLYHTIMTFNDLEKEAI